MSESDNEKFNELLLRRVQEISAEQTKSGIESWDRATHTHSPSSRYSKETLEAHNDNQPVRPESITTVTATVRVGNDRYKTKLNIRGYLVNALMQAYEQDKFSAEILENVLSDFDPRGSNFFTTQAHEFILAHIMEKLQNTTEK